MLFPAKGLLDIFDRNVVGPHWSAVTTDYNNIDVTQTIPGAGGTAFNPGDGGLDALAVGDFFFSGTAEAYVTVDFLGLNPPNLPWTIGVGVRVNQPGGTNHNGIYVMVDLADQMWIVNCGNAAFTAVEGPAFVPFIENSVIGIQAQGDRIAAWVSQPNLGLPGYEVLTHYINNDSFVNRGSGRCALGIFDGGAQVRNFGGGDITSVRPGSPLVLPHSVSGSLR